MMCITSHSAPSPFHAPLSNPSPSVYENTTPSPSASLSDLPKTFCCHPKCLVSSPKVTLEV